MPILQAPPWRRDEPLARRTSFQIGGPAAYFSEPASEPELLWALEEAAERGLPLALLGGGCNTLVLDEGFPGLALSLARFEPSRLEVRAADSRGNARVIVSAGMSLSRFSSELAQRGLSGLEFLSQIPGTVGGAVRMNAGFSRAGDRAETIGRCLASVRVLTWTGRRVSLERSELEFGYRCSTLAGGVIVEAAFELARARPDAVRDAMNENYRYRASVQDLKYPSAGSVFKNPDPPALSVGRMVDALGLKGTRIGGARVSEKHGNFIVNCGEARASDVLALCDLIERAVLETYGITLEKEIRIVGPSLS